jgi:hypothetical protein
MMLAWKMKWVIRICCVVQRPSNRSVQNSISSPPVLLLTFLYHMTTTQQKEKEEEEEEDAMVS